MKQFIATTIVALGIGLGLGCDTGSAANPKLLDQTGAAETAGPAPGDWSNWRGPEQNGMSRETGLPERWNPETNENVVWKNEKVAGMSSPIIMNGKLYTWTRTGEEVFGDGAHKTIVPGPKTQEDLVCVDAKTGKIDWEYKVNMYETDVPFHRLGWGNVAGDPKTGRVYGYGVQGHLVCLDGKTGKPIWYHQMLEEYGQISTFGGRTESPTVDEDQVLITGVAFGWADHAQGQHRCFAFDKATGELRWTANTGGRPVDAPYGTPVITVVHGVRLVCFCGGDGGVYGYEARTGRKVFGYQLSKRGTNATPMIIGTKLIACSSEESEGTTERGRIACIDIAEIDPATKTPKELWKVDGIESGFPSPTTDGKGTVLVMDHSGWIHALSLENGKKLWEKGVGTVGKASLVFADGKVYAADAKNFAIIKPPAPGKRKAEVLSKIELAADAQQLGREYFIFGSPAISNGHVYLQTAGGTWCIGAKEFKPQKVEIPAMETEEPADKSAAPAVVQVVPADLLLRAGEKATFKVRTFDDKGRLLAEDVKADWSVDPLMIPPPPGPAGAGAQPTKAGNLKGSVDSNGTFTSENGPPQGGAITASVTAGGKKVSGFARVRVMPNLPWSIDFEKAVVNKPPLTWLNAGGKFKVIEMPDKNKVLVKTLDFDLYHAARTFFGDTHRSNYTVQADVNVGSKMSGDLRNMPDAGVIANKYQLVLMGNHQQFAIVVWSGALPKEGQQGEALYKMIPYNWSPDKWYRMKLSVKLTSAGAEVKGKVWPKDAAEPKDWTLELVDTQPNMEGSPGLYGESLVTPIKSDIYYDNIVVEPNP